MLCRARNFTTSATIWQLDINRAQHQKIRKTGHETDRDHHPQISPAFSQFLNAEVFLNGNLLGIHRRPKRFMASFLDFLVANGDNTGGSWLGPTLPGLQQLRRRGLVGEFVSIYEDEGSCAEILPTLLLLYVNKDGRGKMDGNSRVQILDTGLLPSATDPLLILQNVSECPHMPQILHALLL